MSQTPPSRSMDWALTGFGFILILSWFAMAINVLSAAGTNKLPGLLFSAAFATYGYLWTLQWILRRSPLATFLWLRYVQRRPVSRVR